MKTMERKKLRSAFIAFAIILIYGSNAYAQEERVWSIGPEIGANISKYGMDGSGSDFKPGLLVGAAINYSIIDNYGITGKILFSQKGSKYTVNGVTNKQTLDYLEIPVLARFYFNRDGRFRPNVFLGPSLGFLLDVRNKSGDDEAVRITGVQRDQFNDFDLGLSGGIGLNYQIWNETRVLLDARYTYGLLDVKEPGNVNNSAIGITAGMSFGF